MIHDDLQMGGIERTFKVHCIVVDYQYIYNCIIGSPAIDEILSDTKMATIRADVNAAKKVHADVPQATRGGMLND